MSGKFASETSVPVEKSRAEIESVLARYGADSFAYATEPGRAIIAFKLKDVSGVLLAVRMTLPLPAKNEKRFTEGWRGQKWAIAPDHAVQARWEQACRSTWRALLLVIKAKLEACAVGISTVEREFLADVMLPGGKTVGEWVRPQLPEVYASGGMPRLLPGGGT
jgi:hypothetical protein